MMMVSRTTSPYSAIRQYARDKRRQVALMELFASRSASAVEEAAPADVDSGDKAHNSSGGSNRGSVQYFSMHPGWSETEGVANALPSLSSGLRYALRIYLLPPPCSLQRAHRKRSSIPAHPRRSLTVWPTARISPSRACVCLSGVR